MKTKIAIISLLAGILTVFTGCEEVKKFEDVSVTAVKNLYSPDNDKYLVLQADGLLYFEWELAYAADNSIVYYEVLFDKENGDFSNPVYIVSADGKGVSTGLTLTHKALNNIARMAGAESGEEISLKWAVRSNRGLNFKLSESSRKLTVVRLVSVDELQPGEKLFITGAGSEDSQQVREIRDGANVSYEIYTKLEADKPFYFYSMLSGLKRTFTTTENKTAFAEVFETPAGETVAATGTYRISIDFTSASVSIDKIDKIQLRVSWTSRRDDFTYAGKGVWELKNYNVQLEATSWGFDERYKFEFTVNGNQEDWGQVGNSDDRPGIGDTGYYNMEPTDNGQWAGTPFKFPNEVCDGSNLSRYTTDITIYLNADMGYTHRFTNIRE